MFDHVLSQEKVLYTSRNLCISIKNKKSAPKIYSILHSFKITTRWHDTFVPTLSLLHLHFGKLTPIKLATATAALNLDFRSTERTKNCTGWDQSYKGDAPDPDPMLCEKHYRLTGCMWMCVIVMGGQISSIPVFYFASISSLSLCAPFQYVFFLYRWH